MKLLHLLSLGFLAMAISTTSMQAQNPSGQGGYLLPSGWLKTVGSQITDQNNNPARIDSVGWPGDDGTGFAPRGLYQVNYQTTMQGMVADGFNTIRIPWNDVLVMQDPYPASGVINYSVNPDLQGLRGMEVLDKIVSYAGTIGLKIIFDHHTNEGGQHGWGGQQPNGLWFDSGDGSNGTDGGGNPGTVTAAQFQQDTIALVMRYKDNSTVIGYDLDNEPLAFGADGESLNWGQGGPTDLWQMYTTVGNAIQSVQSQLLIICEGPQTYSNSGNGLAGIGPEGDLSAIGGVGGVQARPVVLNTSNQVVYSVHEYGPEVTESGQTTGAYNEQPSTLIPHMTADWGYLVANNIAPVWIGEMGSDLDNQVEQTWATTLVDYMDCQYGSQGGPTCPGALEPVGGDWWLWGNFDGEKPDGTLEDDWATPRPDQQAITNLMLFFL